MISCIDLVRESDTLLKTCGRIALNGTWVSVSEQANPADRKPRGGSPLSLRHFTAVGKFWLGNPLCLRPLIRSVGCIE